MAEQKEKIVKRSDKVAYMNVGTDEAPDFQRMRKFTDMSNSANPKEYNRTYVDEDGEVTDVTGYAKEKSFAFDQYTNNKVHEKLVDIIEEEKTGDDAIVDILVVDKTTKTEENKYTARRRKYSVVADSDGDSTDAYTYGGSFKKNGNFEKVTVTLSNDEMKATIEASEAVSLNNKIKVESAGK